jgi:hypothetical protein
MIIDQNNTLERLMYLFTDDKNSHDEEMKELYKNLSSLLKTAQLNDRIFNDMSIIGSGTFGTVKKTNISFDLVIKENKNYKDDLNEIFINQVRINPDVIYKKNPNFPLMYSYIICKPSKKEKICSNDVIDISLYDMDTIKKLLRKQDLKLYGIYEFVNGKTIANYILSLKFLRLSEEEKWNFIKQILIQIFSGLDQLSQSGKYTHFDLHLSNVIIKDEPLLYTYKLTDGTSVNIKDPFRCFIIDQGLSNVEYENKIFVYDYSYKPFLPTFDIYKLVTKLYLVLENFDKNSSENYHVKKMRSLLVTIFGEKVIEYLSKNPLGDVITFMYYSKNDEITTLIDNMSYNDFVRLILEEKEILFF